MNPGLAYPASRSEPSSTPKAKFVDAAAYRLASGGLGARIQASVQSRGPASGTPAAGNHATSEFLLFDGRPPANVAIPLHAPEPPAGARSDVASPAGRPGLVSRGIPFLSPTSSTAREADNDDQSQEPARPHLLATTRGRYDLRHGIASLLRPEDGTRGPAVCGCGLGGHDVDDVSVHLSKEGRAYVTGVYACDSAFLCPPCSRRRALEIQERLTRAVQACIEQGGMVWFVTPTAQRRRDQGLVVMKKGVQDAWREARQGEGWKKPSAKAGVLGVSTVMEAPWSPSTGWGVHLHALVFFDHQDNERAEKAIRLLLSRYLRRLRAHGLKGTSGAQHAERCRDAEKAAKYCAKVASELAHGWVKEGRKDKSTSVRPFAIAAKATLRGEDGEPMAVPGLERVSRDRCRELWREYAAAMPKTRLGAISPQLAAKLGIQAADDQEKARVRQLVEEERIGQLPTPTWDRLVRRALAGTFLSKVESEVDPDGWGWEEVRAWALDVGAEENPGDDAFLRRDPPRPAAPTVMPADLAASAEADRLMALRRVVSVVRSSTGPGTLDRIRRAIQADAAANPNIASPTEIEILRELAA